MPPPADCLARGRELPEQTADRDLGAVGDPEPTRNARPALQRAGRLELGAVEGRLDHRVVPADQDRHERSHPAGGFCFEDVCEPAAIGSERFELEPVGTRQGAVRRELEDDSPARLVFDHRVAERPVATVGANPEGAVEDHRLGHPDVARPHPVAGAAERVEDLADDLQRSRDLPRVDVVDPGHGNLPFHTVVS
jgi:hypothetical protein